MMTYILAMESLVDMWDEFAELAKIHYGEMCERLEQDGIKMPAFNPRVEAYKRASEGGWLKTFTVRLDGKLVGYSTVYYTNDMHNGELIGKEDTIYIAKDHRNGVGKQLVKYVMDYSRSIGVKRGYMQPVTDLRVGKIWKRMGFKPVAETLVYIFDGEANVRT